MKILQVEKTQVIELDKVRDQLIELTKTYMDLSNKLNNNENNN